MGMNPAAFGEASWFDRAKNRHEYLISGDVPDAKSQDDAERKAGKLVEEIAHEFKSLRPDIKKALPRPITKVWRGHQ